MKKSDFSAILRISLQKVLILNTWLHKKMNIKIKHVKLNIYKNYLREAKLSNILSQWDYGWQQSVFIIVSG